jgi:hypothetical protein
MSEVPLQVDVWMVNPGGQQLSIEKAPLEGLYWTLVAIYVTLVYPTPHHMPSGVITC